MIGLEAVMNAVVLLGRHKARGRRFVDVLSLPAFALLLPKTVSVHKKPRGKHKISFGELMAHDQIADMYLLTEDGERGVIIQRRIVSARFGKRRFGLRLVLTDRRERPGEGLLPSVLVRTDGDDWHEVPVLSKKRHSEWFPITPQSVVVEHRGRIVTYESTGGDWVFADYRHANP